MEKRNYVKPVINLFSVQSQTLIATSGETGSGGSTGDSTIAINIIEKCFKIDDSDQANSDINDTYFEGYLVCQNSSGIVLKCDQAYNSDGISLTKDDCYLVTLTVSGETKSWHFTNTDCSNQTNADFSGRVVVSYTDAAKNCFN